MLDFKQRVTKTNLSPQEKETLFSLRQRKGVAVKPADKGGAVAVWARDLYIQEAERQLSDSAFYQKLDSDHTMDHNKKVESTINSNTAPPTEEQAVLLVLTYHPQNTQGREIMTRNFALLKSDPDTKDIF